MPDLLQTRAYAYAVSLGGLPVGDQHAAERHVALQIQRQAALTRRYGPLRLRVVCDEAILHRLVGGSAVMRDQLRHLVELAALPNVTLRIIPFRAGAYPTTPGNFTVMDLPDGTTAVHVQDVATGDRVLTTTEDTHHYADLHTRLQQAALPPAESLELIAAHARPATAPKQTCPRDHWTAPA